MEYFEKVGNQWPIILILLCCIAVIYFRKEIKVFLSNKRITSVAGVGLEDASEKENLVLDTVLDEQPKKESEIVKSQDLEEEGNEIEEKGEESNLSNLFHKILIEEFDKAEEMFAEILKEADNNMEKARITTTYKYYLVRFSSKGSLKDYVTYVESEITEPSILALSNYYLGLCFQKFTNYNEALKCFLLAYDNLDPTERVDCASQVCSCHFELHGVNKAIGKIKEYINVHEEKDKAILYHKLSEFYEKTGDKRMEYLALELAFSNNLFSKKNEFSTAHTAEDGGVFRFVQLFHYNNLFNKIGKNDYYYDAVTNNRGVVLGRLKLSGLAVDDYYRSKDSKDTLAIANLAYLLISIGFYNYAEELLIEASKTEKPHDNVWSALKKVKEERKEESDKLEKYIPIGKRVHQLVQRLAVQKLMNNVPFEMHESVWQMNEVNVNGRIIKEEWKDLEQELEGMSITLSWSEKEDKKGLLQLDFSEDGSAVATFSDDHNKYFNFNDYEGFAIQEKDIIDVFVCKGEAVKFFKLQVKEETV